MQVLPKQTDSPSTETQDSRQSDTVVLNVSGMKCAGCVRAVENRLTNLEGVLSATVNLVTEVAVVEARPGTLTPDQLAEEVTEAGFPTTPRGGEGDRTSTSDLSAWVERKREEQQKQWRRLTIAVILLLLSAIGHLKHFGWLTAG